MAVTTASRLSVDELLDLVDAVVYADVFDAAVTLDELHRYARVAVDRDDLARALEQDDALREVVVQRAGVVALRDRPDLLDGQPERIVHAARLRRRSQRVARVLRHVPFVRGVALTGSVAAGGARPDADVDLLVVVAERRLGTVFVLLGTASRLLGRKLFCPNFYLAETQLGLGSGTVYVGRELAQAQALIGDLGALRDANPWLADMFPNLERVAHGGLGIRAGSLAQRLLELPLHGRLGDVVERWARRTAHRRLRAHYHDAVPAEVRRQLDAGIGLRFHRSGVDRTVPSRYAARRAALSSMLVQARAPAGQAGRSE